MFDHIAAKLKWSAWVVFGIGVCIALLQLAMLSSTLIDGNAIAVLISAVTTLLTFWITALLLYGLGEFLSLKQKQVAALERLAPPPPPTPAEPEPTDTPQA